MKYGYLILHIAVLSHLNIITLLNLFLCDKFTANSASLAIRVVADGHLWNDVYMPDIVIGFFTNYLEPI